MNFQTIVKRYAELQEAKKQRTLTDKEQADLSDMEEMFSARADEYDEEHGDYR